MLDCVTPGLTYSQIATALGVGVGTIQTHIKTLCRKLGVSSKAEAAAWAVRHSWKA
jgi:DNA-binding NarL/FixJ family response regulator